MIYLLPIEVPGYIIPFILKEFDGVSIIYQDGNITTISIEPRSIMGMFLRRNILPSYRIKNYSLTIYTKKLGEKVSFSSEVLEYQNSAQYKVDLTFSELEEFYKFINSCFRISFYFFVKGFAKGSASDQKIKDAINHYIEDYDLLEYGYNEKQLRGILTSYNKKGGGNTFQRNNELPPLFFGT